MSKEVLLLQTSKKTKNFCSHLFQ